MRSGAQDAARRALVVQRRAEGKTYAEIGDELGLTKQSASRLHTQAARIADRCGKALPVYPPKYQSLIR